MGGVLENVIPLSKLIGLLFLFCLPLPSISFLKTKRIDLARPVMGTIFLVYVLVYGLQRKPVSNNQKSRGLKINYCEEITLLGCFAEMDFQHL